MTLHLADQIVRACASAIETQVKASGVKVFAHRRLTLADDADELPAISVDFGAQTPTEENITGFIDSLFVLQVTVAAVGKDEVSLQQELLDITVEQHKAITADQRFGGLSLYTDWAGILEPEFDPTGDVIVGVLQSQWLTYYRMTYSDPTTSS